MKYYKRQKKDIHVDIDSPDDVVEAYIERRRKEYLDEWYIYISEFED